jgi:hypothetical protein
MHAYKLRSPSIKQLSETHLHNIMSNHINASALIFQPAAAIRDPDSEIGQNGFVVATLFAAVCVELEAEGRAQTVSSQHPTKTQNVGKTCLPYEYV